MKASKVVASPSKLVGTIFPANQEKTLIDRDGGVVLKSGSLHRIEWFRSESNVPGSGCLYIAFVPPCVASQYAHLLKFSDGHFFRNFCKDPLSWLIHSRDPDVMERVFLMQDLAEAFGWTAIDAAYALKTPQQMRRRWKSWLPKTYVELVS